MITKHWRLVLRKGKCKVTLYASTTDEMTEADLRETITESLILIARQYHRHPQTLEQNHRDLAIGALMAYAAEPAFDRNGSHIETAAETPSRQPCSRVGGRHGHLVPIWEEPDVDAVAPIGPIGQVTNELLPSQRLPLHQRVLRRF